MLQLELFFSLLETVRVIIRLNSRYYFLISLLLTLKQIKTLCAFKYLGNQTNMQRDWKMCVYYLCKIISTKEKLKNTKTTLVTKHYNGNKIGILSIENDLNWLKWNKMNPLQCIIWENVLCEQFLFFLSMDPKQKEIQISCTYKYVLDLIVLLVKCLCFYSQVQIRLCSLIVASLLAHVCTVPKLRHSCWGSYYPFVEKVKVHCSPILGKANICTIQTWPNTWWIIGWVTI